ncbi:MAG: hypothetical protein IKK43_04300 [Clostridia bacterium]|nr:hypothetical protein [Clostridia bacterium]
MDKKVAGILSYIGPLFLVPLIVVKDDADVKFHVNQGLVLFLFEVIIGIVGGILGAIPLIGGLAGLLGIIPFVLAVLGIVNVCKDETKPLPVIGGITIIK